jgi:hypothetical protein
MITVLLRVIIIVRCKGCGIWVLTAFWGTLFQLAISPFSWVDAAMEGVGGEGRPVDGDRGRPRAGRRRDEEKEYELGGPEEEVFVVAERPRKGGVIRPPPQCGGISRGECCPEDGEDHQTLNGK